MPVSRPLQMLFAACLIGATAAISWVVSGWWLTPRAPGDVQIVREDRSIGAPFVLIDHTGHTVSDASYRGRPLVLYFGWTSDPDIGPAALQVLVSALTRLGAKGEAVVPLFITLDPAWDTHERLALFVAKLHPRLVGLTGSTQEIDALASAYRLYFKRIASASLPNGHSLEHTSHYYVLGTDGRFLTVIPHTTDGGELARELSKWLH